MKSCKFYERDEVAFQEQLAYDQHCADEGYAQYPEEEPELPCWNFCKHLQSHNGFPGETLYCCEHPENKHIVDADSVFDGVTDPDQINRILDAIV